MKSFADLLNALQSPVDATKTKLANILETWSKIGNKTIFAELEGDQSEMDAFLTEWLEENPYNNI